MTDSLTAHASPSDTSFSPDWQGDRAGRQFYSFVILGGKSRADLEAENIYLFILRSRVKHTTLTIKCFIGLKKVLT